jgi:hypothetical protein
MYVRMFIVSYNYIRTSREKEISIKENAIKEKEKELNEVTIKLASAQTYILNLEKRITVLVAI